MQTKFVKTCWERRCVSNTLARFQHSYTRVLSLARPYKKNYELRHGRGRAVATSVSPESNERPVGSGLLHFISKASKFVFSFHAMI